MLLPIVLLTPALQRGYVPKVLSSPPLAAPDEGTLTGRLPGLRSARWRAPYSIVLFSGCSECSVAVEASMKQLEDSGSHERTVVALVDAEPALVESARHRYPWTEVIAAHGRDVASLNPWFSPRVYRLDATGKVFYSQKQRALTPEELGEAIDGRP